MTEPHSRDVSRRQFLSLAGGVSLFSASLSGYHRLAAAAKKQVRIRDVQAMVLQGARTYTLVRIVADDGLYGIAEAYGTPAVGVRSRCSH